MCTCRPQVQKLEQCLLRLPRMMLLPLQAKPQSLGLPPSLTRQVCLLTQGVHLSQSRHLQVSCSACVFMLHVLASTSCCCSVQTYSWSHAGSASPANATPAPAKRRKLLVLGISKDIKLQQTSNRQHSSPPAAAKSLADDGSPHCNHAASSMPEVQKTHKSKPKSGAPHSLGESLSS